jgi:hypothetical protein
MWKDEIMNDHSKTPPATSGVSRRAFLARTAALGSAPLFASCASSSNFGRREKQAAAPRVPLADDEPIRIGVIGTGGMGGGHCHAIMGLGKAGEENVQIVAVCDVCDSRLEGARKACADKQSIRVDTYRNYHEILSRDDIHGVLIATPEHWHGTMARDALWAGKDVEADDAATR